MFNNSTYNNTVNIKPACSGMLQKSHPKSFFLNFHKDSKMANWIFNENPCLKRKTSDYVDHYQKYMDIAVLQVVISGDYFFCEVVNANEFEDNKQETNP